VTFRPRLWPTLIALPALILLLTLGFWQLERREWKHALLAELEARQAAPPIALPQTLDPDALEFRRVRLRGSLLHERELYWAARTLDGRSGYHVLTPLRLEDGREILLDRGWLAPEQLDRETRREALPPLEVAVVATVRRGGWGGPGWAGWLRPANDPEGNRWLWPDLPAMAAAADLKAPVTRVYAVAEPGELPAPPLARGVALELRDNHLQYALFWFAMAAALLLIYLLFHRRPRGGRSPGSASSPPADRP